MRTLEIRAARLAASHAAQRVSIIISGRASSASPSSRRLERSKKHMQRTMCIVRVHTQLRQPKQSYKENKKKRKTNRWKESRRGLAWKNVFENGKLCFNEPNDEKLSKRISSLSTSLSLSPLLFALIPVVPVALSPILLSHHLSFGHFLQCFSSSVTFSPPDCSLCMFLMLHWGAATAPNTQIVASQW